MSRVAVLFSLLAISGLNAQESPPAVGLPPPIAPASTAPIIPVAPPIPGQLQAVPALPPPVAEKLSPASGMASQPVPGPAAKVSPAKPKTGSSTSTTGQFIVHGDDFTLRSALSSKCEDIATELRTLLHDKSAWSLPIVVLLNSGESARKADKTVTTTISQLTHGGFHLQVNVNVRPDLRPSDLRKEIIRALLAERILRDQKEISAKRNLLLPDWLFLGILEATEYRQRARPSTLFAAIFKSGKIFGIEEIIEASAAEIDDALSKSIYQTSCCALVLALLDQPDSGLRMGKFLNSLASDPRTERELLNQWFPNFATSDASLNKWWALQLATLASPGMTEPLSPQDTVTALEDALTFRYQAKPSEIPQSSRPVLASVKPSVKPSAPKPIRSSEVPEIKASEEPKTEPEIATEEPKEKRSFISRLNPFSRRKTSDEEITAAIEEAARAEAESTVAETLEPAAESQADTSAEPAASPAHRKPLFDRWFQDNKKPKDEDKIEPAKPDKADETKVDEPKAPSTNEPEAEKKPSNLNPLNWFRSGKKEKAAEDNVEEPAPEKADKDKKASLSTPSDPITSQLLSGGPILALVYQEIAVEADKPVVEKKRFFGLFGKKRAEADPAEPEAPKKIESEPKETAPLEEPKPTAEKTEKPKRQPLRLNLFGSDKKDEEPKKEDEPKEDMPVETVPKPEAPSKPKPEVAKRTPAKNETAVAAAIPIEDYAAILKRPDLAKIMERNVNALATLQNRGSVLFRPIVSDYVRALEDILKGQTKGMDARLRSLRTRTQETLEKSNAIRDLLDLHEANDSPAMSGLFEDYLKLPETIRNELPERTDPISKYLDALDKEFSKD